MFWLIDAPARLIGALAGPLVALGALLLSLMAGAGVGYLADTYLLPAGMNASWRKWISLVIGIVAWLYVGMVLYRAQHWAAFSLLENAASD